ncbi:MAG: anthranilate phosphoribosyltransferase [Alphaproteobacteria bacterium]|nr:anthranilate phosphoribosyltransferase [Alphaproteobacteria bacterium]
MSETAKTSPAGAVWGAFMDELCSDALDDKQKTALLSHVGDDLVTGEMLAACAQWLLARAVPLHIAGIDVCGTGGDKSRNSIKTFNISTAVAFVAAAAGASVVKHGNRAVSSSSGSSDVLAALGVPVCTTAAEAESQHAAHGLCFVSAPAFHPTLSLIADVRRAVGRPTFLNLLGPLCNPARTAQQLFGVYDASFLPAMMEAARALGRETVTGVHSEDGLDEISISAPTHLYTLRGGDISHALLTPESCGVERAPIETLKGGGPEENAHIIAQVFAAPEGPRADIITLNAGAALVTADKAEDWKDGVRQARAALRDGRALEKLRQMRGKA